MQRPSSKRSSNKPSSNKQTGKLPQATPGKFSSKPIQRHSAPKSFSPQRGSLPEGVFVVEGSAAIKEYLRFRPQTVLKVFVKEKQLNAVRVEFSGFDVKFEMVKDVSNDDVDSSLPSTPVWAHIKHELIDLTTFEQTLASSKGKMSILVLDHISDPRNLGAIIRSAAFFGVKHVIVPERRQVLLTHSAVATAQGGFALCDLVVVVNVARILQQLKEHRFWILGAAMDGEPLDNFRGKFERQVIVLGSEDKGISPNVLSKCDVKVAISGAKHSLDSLNVSVAAGIMLQRLVVLP